MTDSSSTTVNSYSVHEDQLKWFDVPLVAGAKAAVWGKRNWTFIRWSGPGVLPSPSRALRTGGNARSVDRGGVSIVFDLPKEPNTMRIAGMPRR